MTILPPKGSRAILATALAVLAGTMIVLLLPALPVGGPFGRNDARRDIANGRFRIFTGMADYGWQNRWKEALRNKYGIEAVGRTRSCFAGGFLGSYEHAYNAEQRAKVVQCFGKDVVREEMLLAIQMEKAGVAWR